LARWATTRTPNTRALSRTLGRFPLRIYPATNSSFPALNDGEVITVEYTSGVLTSTDEEYLIGKRAMLLLIGHWFE
jgi:hypothetical protein